MTIEEGSKKLKYIIEEVKIKHGEADKEQGSFYENLIWAEEMRQDRTKTWERIQVQETQESRPSIV